MEQRYRIQPMACARQENGGNGGSGGNGGGSGSDCCVLPDVTVYPSLAMVYPPRQVWRNLYDSDAGFGRGTIFRELDKPFAPDKC